jgi:hypothetical protein
MLVALGWSDIARAADPSAAREQVKIGYTLAHEGRCDEAVPHLLESLRLDPRAITLINLADCEEKLGRLGLAMGHWVEARTRAESEGARAIEEEATKRALGLDARLPRLTIVLAPAAPPHAVVERDGVVLGPPSLGIALPIDPGWHAITVKSPGRLTATTTVLLAEGEEGRVDIDVGAPIAPGRDTPPPPARKVPWSFPPLAALGIGIGTAGLGVGAATIALDERNDRVGAVATIGISVAVAGVAMGLAGLLGTPQTTPVARMSQGRVK